MSRGTEETLLGAMVVAVAIVLLAWAMRRFVEPKGSGKGKGKGSSGERSPMRANSRKKTQRGAPQRSRSRGVDIGLLGTDAKGGCCCFGGGKRTRSRRHIALADVANLEVLDEAVGHDRKAGTVHRQSLNKVEGWLEQQPDKFGDPNDVDGATDDLGGNGEDPPTVRGQ